MHDRIGLPGEGLWVEKRKSLGIKPKARTVRRNRRTDGKSNWWEENKKNGVQEANKKMFKDEGIISWGQMFQKV